MEGSALISSVVELLERLPDPSGERHERQPEKQRLQRQEVKDSEEPSEDPYALLKELRLDGHRLGSVPWLKQKLGERHNRGDSEEHAGLALLFTRFKSLRSLHLAKNRITTLVGSGLEHLGRTLEELHLSNNDLDTLWLSPPERASSVQHAADVDADKIDSSCQGCPLWSRLSNLRVLDVSQNQATLSPHELCAVRQARGLREVRISSPASQPSPKSPKASVNALSVSLVRNAFEMLPQLEKVVLDGILYEKSSVMPILAAETCENCSPEVDDLETLISSLRLKLHQSEVKQQALLSQLETTEQALSFAAAETDASQLVETESFNHRRVSGNALTRDTDEEEYEDDEDWVQESGDHRQSRTETSCLDGMEAKSRTLAYRRLLESWRQKVFQLLVLSEGGRGSALRDASPTYLSNRVSHMEQSNAEAWRVATVSGERAARAEAMAESLKMEKDRALQQSNKQVTELNAELSVAKAAVERAEKDTHDANARAFEAKSEIETLSLALAEARTALKTLERQTHAKLAEEMKSRDLEALATAALQREEEEEKWRLKLADLEERRLEQSVALSRDNGELVAKCSLLEKKVCSLEEELQSVRESMDAKESAWSNERDAWLQQLQEQAASKGRTARGTESLAMATAEGLVEPQKWNRRSQGAKKLRRANSRSRWRRGNAAQLDSNGHNRIDPDMVIDEPYAKKYLSSSGSSSPGSSEELDFQAEEMGWPGRAPSPSGPSSSKRSGSRARTRSSRMRRRENQILRNEEVAEATASPSSTRNEQETAAEPVRPSMVRERAPVSLSKGISSALEDMPLTDRLALADKLRQLESMASSLLSSADGGTR